MSRNAPYSYACSQVSEVASQVAYSTCSSVMMATDECLMCGEPLTKRGGVCKQCRWDNTKGRKASSSWLKWVAASVAILALGAGAFVGLTAQSGNSIEILQQTYARYFGTPAENPATLQSEAQSETLAEAPRAPVAEAATLDSQAQPMAHNMTETEAETAVEKPAITETAPETGSKAEAPTTPLKTEVPPARQVTTELASSQETSSLGSALQALAKDDVSTCLKELSQVVAKNPQDARLRNRIAKALALALEQP